MAQKYKMMWSLLLLLLHVVDQSTSLPSTYTTSTMIVAPHTYEQQKLLLKRAQMQREKQGYFGLEPASSLSETRPETTASQRVSGASDTGTKVSGSPETDFQIAGASELDQKTAIGESERSRTRTANMKTGYSKVASQSAILGQDGLRLDDNGLSSAKSMDLREDGEKNHEEEEEEEEDDDGGDGTSSYSEISSSLSAKDSLANFMRANLRTPSGPMTAQLTYDLGSSDAKQPIREAQLSSIMKNKLSDFVKKYMGGLLKAEIQEVRVEQRPNGLQEYNRS